MVTITRLADYIPLWHPVEAQTNNQLLNWELAFNALVKTDPAGSTILPDLAGSWDVSPNAKEFTFHLVTNATWQDGTPFTASDVAFTINWAAQYADAFKGGSNNWNQIVGFGAVKGTTQAVSGVTVVDDHTIKLTLADSDSDYLRELSYFSNVILPEHILKNETGATIENSQFIKGTAGVTIGTGPYKLVSASDRLIEYAANPTYFKGAPKIEKVFVRFYSDPAAAIAALQSGELDVAVRLSPTEYDTLASNPNLNVVLPADPGNVRLILASEKPPFNNAQVRQAVYYAINRKAIVDSYFKGRARVLTGPNWVQDSWTDLNAYAYDPAKARELLAAAKYDSSTKVRMYYDSSFPAIPDIAPLIQADLKAVGMNVELNPLDSQAALDTRQKRAFEISVDVGGNEGTARTMTAFLFCQTPSLIGVTDATLCKLFDQARATGDATARDELYHQAAKSINDAANLLYLYEPKALSAVNKRVDGGLAVHVNHWETPFEIETWTVQP